MDQWLLLQLHLFEVWDDEGPHEHCDAEEHENLGLELKIFHVQKTFPLGGVNLAFRTDKLFVSFDDGTKDTATWPIWWWSRGARYASIVL